MTDFSNIDTRMCYLGVIFGQERTLGKSRWASRNDRNWLTLPGTITRPRIQREQCLAGAYSATTACIAAWAQ
jgi:hypothetical protein